MSDETTPPLSPEERQRMQESGARYVSQLQRERAELLRAVTQAYNALAAHRVTWRELDDAMRWGKQRADALAALARWVPKEGR